MAMVETMRPKCQLISIAEAASLCGVNRRTLRRWSRSGLAPKPLRLKNGPRGSLRYRLGDLVEWISEGCEPVEAGR